MRCLVPVLGVLMLSLATARADDATKTSREGADRAAKLVWGAFQDGVAPAPDVSREARRVIEAFVDAIPVENRAGTRIHVESVDVLLAKVAWASGDRLTAKSRAEAVLAALPGRRKDWDSGNILHEMHILLGRVALEAGDLSEADRELLEAARTPGSPQLDTFGPDWTLARDLLARGRRAAVAQYVRGVGAFWEMGRDRLAEWQKTLDAGGTPQFLPEPKAQPKDRKPAGPAKVREEAPPLGTPDGIVGCWESTAKSRGGIGQALEFRADGTVAQHMIVLVDLKYRVDGATIVLDAMEEGEKESAPEGVPIGKLEADTWTFGEGAEAVVKKRVGPAGPGAPSVVGTWSYDHPAGIGTHAFERFDADGWMRFRLVMPGGASPGTYERKDLTLKLTFDGKAASHALSITGDRLRLVSEDPEPQTNEYRYVGARAWYMPAPPAK